MSITELLLLTHLASTAALAGVLGLVIGLQALSSRVARLRHRVSRWGAGSAAAPSAAGGFGGVDRRRPVHSSG